MNNYIDNKNKMIELALSYKKKGWSVIPCNKNKIPSIAWKEFQGRIATDEEIKTWFEIKPEAQVGIVTGKISNLTVVDVEKGGDPSFLPQETMIVGTGGDGYHYYFEYEEGISNKARIRDLVDIRSEGGYVVAPGSSSDKGSYSILQDKEKLLSFPKEMFPKKVDIFQSTSKGGSYDSTGENNLKSYPGFAKGQRNDEMARYIGYVLTQIHPLKWDDVAWDIIKKANDSNTPPLPSYELSETFKSIKRLDLQNNPTGRNNNNNNNNTYKEEEDEPLYLDENDEILHMSEVADSQELDSSEIFPLEMECFDDIIGGGVNMGDVIAVAGQTSHGKTSLIQDWTISLIRGEKKVKALWFSYEVLPVHLWKKFKEMGANKEDLIFAPLKQTTGKISWVEKKIREGKEKFGIKAVFIDHLGFLLPKTEGVMGRNMSSNYATFLTQIMRDLKSVAIKEEVIIFLPVHMKKVDSRNRLSDVDDIKDCVVEGEKVVVNDKLIPIEKVKKGDMVYSLGISQQIVPRKVKDVWKTGEKETYEIVTKSGRRLKCSGGHKFYATSIQEENKNGWTKLKDLQVNQKIVIAKSIPELLNIKNFVSEKINYLYFDKIKEINYIGKNQTWDLEVESKRDIGHSFIVEGIMTHNSAGVAQESDLVFIIERERNKEQDADTYYTDRTKISLAKNRKTGTTAIKNFTMINGRFAYDDSEEKAKIAFDSYTKIEKLEPEEKEEEKEILIKKENPKLPYKEDKDDDDDYYNPKNF